jgi:hypothetical protein
MKCSAVATDIFNASEMSAYPQHIIKWYFMRKTILRNSGRN